MSNSGSSPPKSTQPQRSLNADAPEFIPSNQIYRRPHAPLQLQMPPLMMMPPPQAPPLPPLMYVPPPPLPQQPRVAPPCLSPFFLPFPHPLMPYGFFNPGMMIPPPPPPPPPLQQQQVGLSSVAGQESDGEDAGRDDPMAGAGPGPGSETRSDSGSADSLETVVNQVVNQDSLKQYRDCINSWRREGNMAIMLEQNHGNNVGTPSNELVNNKLAIIAKQPPGPWMPDGTRGFSMGQGKLITVELTS